jgi:hypothetical protein
MFMLPEQQKLHREAHPISASQLDTAMLCERKWAYLKLARLEAPSNKYAAFGTEVHSVLEAWQRTGKNIDLSSDIGKVVAPGLRLLPQPGTHTPEHSFRFDSGRAVYHGFMDLRGPATFRIQTVWDHKSTTNLNWMKTPEFLRKDPQAVLYAEAVLREAAEKGVTLSNGIDRVELNWVYYVSNPKKPRSKKVQLHVVPDDATRLPLCPENVEPKHFGIMRHSELAERFEELEQVSERLLQLYADQPKPEELPPNAAACSAYGGCPFKDKPCNLSIRERMRSMEAQGEAKTLTLAEKVRAKLGAKKAEEGSTLAAKVASAPAAPVKPAGAVASATQGVNPPERANGTNPDEPPATPAATAAPAARTQSAAGYGRAELAGLAMQAVIARGTHSSTDPKYAAKVVADSVMLADTMLAALSK